MIKLTWAEVYERIDAVFKKVSSQDKFYGVPRGGAIVAGLTDRPAETPEEADVIIDDIYDSGATYKKWKKLHPNKEFRFLVDKRKEYKKEWIQFPWEEDNIIETEENVVRILESIGEDPKREGLIETPKRYLKFLNEFTNPPIFKFTSFEAEGMDQMIVQQNIPFYSLCEHHMAPFFGKGAIAYIPDGSIVGISKLARTLEFVSRRLQNQERITQDVADRIQSELKPKGVAVFLKAKHLCMEMRGVKKHDTYTSTSCLLGVFKERKEARDEFFNIIK